METTNFLEDCEERRHRQFRLGRRVSSALRVVFYFLIEFSSSNTWRNIVLAPSTALAFGRVRSAGATLWTDTCGRTH
jgi:hypothetical protein